ncbi:MAG TPA: ribonuclease P protein component [Actinomycetota bacterium]|nr:ribonuclease P protein component [Actinomycetota bacterium]
MPSIQSLSGKPSFARVHATGRRCSRDGVTAIVATRESGPARLGLAVGKSAGKAVVRNKIRRRLREAVRAYDPGPADVVLIGRAALATEPFSRVEEYVKTCLESAGAPKRSAR